MWETSTCGVCHSAMLGSEALLEHKVFRLAKWQGVRTSICVQAGLRELQLEQKVQADAREHSREEEDEALGEEQETFELPYWQKGDATMYSVEKLRERYRLRRHPDVLEALHVYWTTMLRSAFFSTVVGLETVIVREDYVRFARKLFKVCVRGRGATG